jgi:tRNA(fMet)-specific endonuclease VapC
VTAYLLDTNVVSEPLKPTPSERLMARLAETDGKCAIASPVWHELLFGASRLPRSKRRTLLETYLHDVVKATLPILAYDESAAAWHAEHRARLTKRGKPPSFVAGQIAAIAAVNDLTLVTRNVRHFRAFKIAVEDWT